MPGSSSRLARNLVRFPGSGGPEHDNTRPLSEAARRRLADLPPDLPMAGKASWFDLPPLWLKLAGVALLAYGAYLAGWSSAEPAQGTSAPQTPRREIAMPAPSSSSVPSALAVVAPPAETATALPTPPSTATMRRLSDEEFREVQAKLAALGHDPGPVDGFFGPQTIAAVKRYEIASGQEPTGNIDLRLLQRLRGEP